MASTTGDTPTTAGERALDAADAADAAACGDCPDNSAQIKGALIQLQIKHFRENNFKVRLGEEVGDMTYKALVSITKSGARQIKRRYRVPYPNVLSRSANRYKDSVYNVYEIYGVSKGPTINLVTWKYGITRQDDPNSRPQSQLGKCRKNWAIPTGLAYCNYLWWYRNIVGWVQARTLEADLGRVP